MRQGSECACTESEDPDPQKKRGIADTWGEEVGGGETGHDLVRAEAGGVAGASGVVERVRQRDAVAGVDTNRVKQ